MCPSLQKHLAALPVPVDLLLLLAIGSSRTFAGPLSELSFSECLQLERSPLGAGRTAKVLSVREGMPAYLHCPRLTDGAANSKAAWTRMNDMALLAVGTGSFTQDLRFQVSKPKDSSSDWVLILRRTNLEDQGCYLCEINSEPVSTLVPVYLKVNPAKWNSAEQQKRREGQHQQQGSADDDEQPKRSTRLQARIEGTVLLLNCTVERSQHESAFWPSIVWLRDGQPLDLRNERKFGTDFSEARDQMEFILRVKDLEPAKDSGVYACQGDRLLRSVQIVSLPANSALTLVFLSIWLLCLLFLPLAVFPTSSFQG